MTELYWEPIDIDTEITSLGSSSSFFLQKASSKTLLFVHEADITCLMIFTNEETGLTFNYTKIIQSTSEVLKISGNNDCILMLDKNEELFYLKLTFKNITLPLNPSVADENLCSEAELTWCRLHQLTNCLGMIGVTDAIIFLYHNQSLYAAMYKTKEIGSGLKELSSDRIGYCISTKQVFGAIIQGEIVNDINSRFIKDISPSPELILIIAESQLLFSKPTLHGQILSEPHGIDFRTDSIVSVMNFDKQNCVLVICKTGKIVYLKFPKSSKSFQSSHLWLPQKVFAVTGYENDGILLLWSDLMNLNVSKLNEDDELIQLKVFHNVRGIRHFVKIDKNILALTRNGCLFKTTVSPKLQQKALKLSTSEVLKRIYKLGNEVETLNKELEKSEYLLRALDIFGSPTISSQVYATQRGNQIVIENKTDFTFKKNLWRMKLETEDFNRRLCEIEFLDKDITPGHSNTFQWDHATSGKLKITLICETRRAADILVSLEIKSLDDALNQQPLALADLKQYLENNFVFIA